MQRLVVKVLKASIKYQCYVSSNEGTVYSCKNNQIVALRLFFNAHLLMDLYKL